MIRFQQVCLMRGIKPLLENVDLTLNPGDKIGLIGANGAGKSSLFGLLRGELHADQGEIDFPAKWRMAYVAQETPALDRPALEYAIDGDVTLRRLEAELADAGSAAESTANGIAIGELHGALADADAYTVHSRAEQLLLGLGFTLEQMQQPVASFSGGWRMRLNLAQALMCPSDLLLLDEPTNHLDLDAIIWLEDWLKRYAGTLIIISHDRDFLDGVVNVIVHIDERKLKRYSGNYSVFERQRAAQMVLAQGTLEKQTAPARPPAILHRPLQGQGHQGAPGAKPHEGAGQDGRAGAAARRRRILVRIPRAAVGAQSAAGDGRRQCRLPHARTQTTTASAKRPSSPASISRCRSASASACLGVNGAGKSTLIKTIAGELAPLAGDATLRQGPVDRLLRPAPGGDAAPRRIAAVAPGRDRAERARAGTAQLPRRLQLPRHMVTSPIAPFSGGEKARLALALIVWQRPNLLLLDEPTNHLDLETREALTEALAQFEGTLVLVSHDRHLLRATTDQFIIVADGKLQPFDGDLDDYRDWLFKTKLADKTDAAAAPLPEAAKKTAAPEAAAPAAAGDRREQKRAEAEERQRLAALKKPIEARIKRLEEQIAKCNAKKAAIDARLAAPEIYDDANKEELKTLLSDQAYQSRELAQLEAEWLEQQEALEQVLA